MAADGLAECCPVCKKSVEDDQQAVQCEFFCKLWYHCSCVNITTEEYKYMQLLYDKSKWSCGPCDARLNKVILKIGDIDSLIQVNTTVDRLVSIVKGVVDNNLSLNERLICIQDSHNRLESLLLKTKQEVDSSDDDVIETQIFELKSSSDNRPEIPVDSIDDDKAIDVLPELLLDGSSNNLVAGEWEKKKNELVKKNHEEVLDRSYAAAVLSKKGTKKTEKVKAAGIEQTVNGDRNKRSKAGKPAERSRTIVIGSNSEKVGLKTVDKSKWVFISRCSPETTVDNIVKYFSDENIEVSKCEKLKTRYDDYSSFKVCVPVTQFEKVLTSGFWPRGVFVKEFDLPRKTFKGSSNFVRRNVFLGKTKDS